MRKFILFVVSAFAVVCFMRMALPFVSQPMFMGGTGPVTASLTASPASIASGASSTLAWSSTNAASCTSPGSLGNTAIPSFTGATSGSVSSGALTATTTYSVQCGTATAAATVTVTGGGGTVACAIGQPYQGSVPAPAAAAGFTKCAFNIDMTQTYYQTLSNWLDCSADVAGAKTPALTPVMWNESQTGWNTGGFAANCDNSPPPWAFVTDGGVPALKITTPTASGTGVGRGESAISVKPGVTTGQLFPMTMYLEVRYRIDSTGNSVCQNTIAPGSSAACTPFTIFPYIDGRGTPGAAPWVEWDFIETFVQSNYGAITGKAPNNAHPTRASLGFTLPVEYSNTGENCCAAAVGVVADLTTYHTYGDRMVSDGIAGVGGSGDGNFTWCAYHSDGAIGTAMTLDHCSKGLYNNGVGSTSDVFDTRLLLNLQDYAVQSMNNSGPMISYMVNYSLWTCPNGLNAPPLNQVAANPCLNSTADVTGRLAGAP